jgi:tRNA threonylcarbamoyladenosine biosynthesis protein TsaE
MVSQNIKLEELPNVVSDILREFPNERIFALQGEMGAGKTTFSKLFCKALGTEDEVSSPTFAIANIYDSTKYGELYHFDFYRLDSVQEAMDIGFDDYVYSGNYCLMEWPDLIIDYIPRPFVEVRILHGDNNDVRNIEAKLIE